MVVATRVFHFGHTAGRDVMPASERKADPFSEIARAVAKLETYHALGKSLLRQHPPGKRHRLEAIRQEAAEHHLNPDTVYKIRAFASTRGYTDAELQTLIGLCWKHSRALGFAFIPRFMTISRKSERAVFARQAIENHWSLAAVERELVNRHRGQRRAVGRKPGVTGSVRDLCAGLQTKSIYWRHLRQVLHEKHVPGSARSYWSALSADVRKRLDNAVDVIEALEEALHDYLKQPAGKRKSRT